MNNVQDNGFNRSQQETENLVGGANNLPKENNSALSMFAAQFLQEFQAKYQQLGYVGLRTCSGLSVYADRCHGVRNSSREDGVVSIGALALSSSKEK